VASGRDRERGRAQSTPSKKYKSLKIYQYQGIGPAWQLRVLTIE
jgi:hypothetical protein